MMAAAVSRHSATATDSPMTASPRSTRNRQLPTESQSKDQIATAVEGRPAADSGVSTIGADVNAGKDPVSATTNAPLAPPPKPSQSADSQDYFSGQHNQSLLSKEPNPFENAFGGTAETPGKTQLPGVTSLTSPASLVPGNTPGWPNSLRSGPLSPAMLTGPTGSNDYFTSEHHFPGSFPTPNESSLRTGLTPGGGGSMFPQPSPNSQALYNQLQSGGATPGTLDFHRTAMTARAQQAHSFNLPPNGATSNPTSNIQPDLDSKAHPNGQQPTHDRQDPFGSHQTTDAANGLFMLAQAGGQRSTQQSFGIPQPPQPGFQQGVQQDVKREPKHSIGSSMSGSTEGPLADYSDASQDAKPQTRARVKKGNSTSKTTTNGKRKTEDTPSKASNKKQRASQGSNVPVVEPDEDEPEPEPEPEAQEIGADGKKMTDEEKRKNFLERNRIAALKCRQRKKQWLANLQQKVEIFSTENDALAATVTQLREEIVGLKTLLLAHKDCPVSQAQGITAMQIQQIAGDTQHYNNPYGMAAMGTGGPGGMPQQGQLPQANMQRR